MNDLNVLHVYVTKHIYMCIHSVHAEIPAHTWVVAAYIDSVEIQ